MADHHQDQREASMAACTSCDTLFDVESYNDRDEGYFCNVCLNLEEAEPMTEVKNEEI